MELPAHLPVGFLNCQFPSLFVKVLQVDRVGLLLSGAFKARQLLIQSLVEIAAFVCVPCEQTSLPHYLQSICDS